VLQPAKLGDEAFLSGMRDLDPDLAVVAAYGRLLPQALLDVPRLGFVNVHASLLPKYRGAAPVHRAVMVGETLTGVTIMRVVLALDAGPILAARERSILEHETSLDVERDLAMLGAALLVDMLPDLEAGRLVEVPQDEQLATYAPRLTKADGAVDWTRSAPAIRDQIRGLHPWPHAFGFLEGARYLFHRAAVEPDVHEQPVGTVLRAAGDFLTVAAGGGTTLRLLVVQPEGRRPLTARELVAGRRIREGARFGPPPGS
jgi:methionyl-tRNA formyltransferase